MKILQTLEQVLGPYTDCTAETIQLYVFIWSAKHTSQEEARSKVGSQYKIAKLSQRCHRLKYKISPSLGTKLSLKHWMDTWVPKKQTNENNLKKEEQEQNLQNQTENT